MFQVCGCNREKTGLKYGVKGNLKANCYVKKCIKICFSKVANVK
jgi:hypothetical protein